MTLAKRHIQANEYPWYLLEMKNVGRKPITIEDIFWITQRSLRGGGNTRFEVIGPDGKIVPMGGNPRGTFGGPSFWTNDCGGGKDCENVLQSFPPGQFSLVLKGGETMVATPSMIAPIRPPNPRILDATSDPRDLPEIPKGWPKEKVDALRKDWKQMVEQSGYTMGDPTFRPNPKEPAVSRPRGYRVLEEYDGMFERPGKYKMRAVFAPPAWSQPKWLKHPQWYESNWVEFEVKLAPFPEHLFPRRPNETSKQRALRERFERKMREKFEWSGEGIRPRPGLRKQSMGERH